MGPDGGGLDQDGSSGAGERWTESGDTLKIKSKIRGGLHMFKRKRGEPRMAARFLPKQQEDGLAIKQNVEDCEYIKFHGEDY